MNTIRNIFQAIKTTLKFLWRHCLTLYFSTTGFYAIVTEDVFIHRIFIAIFVMALLDWTKMKIKLTPNRDRLGSTTPILQTQSPCNYHMVGTASYLSSIGHR